MSALSRQHRAITSTKQIVLPAEQPGDVGLEVVEQLRVEDHAVLDHFAQSGAIVSLGQRVERRRVDQDAHRLQERADHVLRARQIDADLAADAAVDLGQQRRGDLEEADAPGVGGRDEPGQIADHAAADGDDDRLAVGAEFEEPFPESGGHLDRLARFARLDGHEIDRKPLARQALGDADGVGFLDVGVGDDHGVRDLAQRGERRADVGEIVRADLDVVASLGEIDADGVGGMGHGDSILLPAVTR